MDNNRSHSNKQARLPRLRGVGRESERLDRLGWNAGISIICHGVSVGIRANTPEVLEELHAFLPPGWQPYQASSVARLYSLWLSRTKGEGRRRSLYSLYSDQERLIRTGDSREAFDLLESDLRLHVATKATDRLFVHAGVVGWHGKAIVLPGRSYSGKTTLVAALVKAGATYYSDEYALFDAEGRVHPFAKKLSIRDNNGGARRCAAEELGGTVGEKPLPVGLIAVAEYRAGAQWRPRRLSPGRAVLSLLANTVPAREQPRAALSILRQVASQAPVLKGTRGEAELLASTFLRQCMRGCRTPEAVTEESAVDVPRSAD